MNNLESLSEKTLVNFVLDGLTENETQKASTSGSEQKTDVAAQGALALLGGVFQTVSDPSSLSLRDAVVFSSSSSQQQMTETVPNEEGDWQAKRSRPDEDESFVPSKEGKTVSSSGEEQEIVLETITENQLLGPPIANTSPAQNSMPLLPAITIPDFFLDDLYGTVVKKDSSLSSTYKGANGIREFHTMVRITIDYWRTYHVKEDIRWIDLHLRWQSLWPNTLRTCKLIQKRAVTLVNKGIIAKIAKQLQIKDLPPCVLTQKLIETEDQSNFLLDEGYIKGLYENADYKFNERQVKSFFPCFDIFYTTVNILYQMQKSGKRKGRTVYDKMMSKWNWEKGLRSYSTLIQDKKKLKSVLDQIDRDEKLGRAIKVQEPAKI